MGILMGINPLENWLTAYLNAVCVSFPLDLITKFLRVLNAKAAVQAPILS